MTLTAAAPGPIKTSKPMSKEPITPLRRKARISDLRLKAAEAIAVSSIEGHTLILKTVSEFKYGSRVPDQPLTVEKAVDSLLGK